MQQNFTGNQIEKKRDLRSYESVELEMSPVEISLDTNLHYQLS